MFTFLALMFEKRDHGVYGSWGDTKGNKDSAGFNVIRTKADHNQARPGLPLECRNNGNFHQQIRAGKTALHTGPGRGGSFNDPGIPHRVHGSKILHVPEINGGGQEMFSVTARLFQQGVHLGQHIFCLGTGSLVRVIRHLAAQVYGFVVNDNATHSCCCFHSGDGAHFNSFCGEIFPFIF